MPKESVPAQSTPAPVSALHASVQRPRGWLWALAAVLILAAGFGGFAVLHKFKPRAAVKPMARELPIVRTEALQVRSGGLPVVGNGLIQPSRQVTLASEIAARVVTISPRLVTGGAIQKGETLVQVDAAPFKAALSQATAEWRSAKSGYELALQSVKRTEGLIKQGFLSRQTLDERIATRDQALAAMQRASAVYQQRRISVLQTKIEAPFDGRVLSASINPGDMVQPGRELAKIFADDALEVVVALTSADMALIDNAWAQQASTPVRAAASAIVRVNHGGTRFAWPAQVERVEAAIDAATRTFNVVVRVLEPKALGVSTGPRSAGALNAPPLLVGMYANVQISGRDQGEYLLIPRAALRDKNQIWLVGPDNTVRIEQTRVLTEIDDKVAVKVAVIDPAARLITSDLRVVTPGLAVRVTDRPEKQSAVERPKT